MRIVLDTNVLVSGLLSPFGPPAEVVGLITGGAVQVCYDARILAEYRQVLLRPAFPFTLVQVETLLVQIEADGMLVGTHPLPERLPDPDDEAFLAVALAGRVRYLVTGNLKHFPAKSRQKMRVVSPRDFLELFRKEGMRGRAE